MDPLTFTDTFAGAFAQLVLTAGLAVMVLAVAVGWAKAATRTDEGTPDE